MPRRGGLRRRSPADPRDVLPLLGDRLSAADLRVLARVGTEFRCPARWPLIRQGTPADDLYLIAAGSADVYRDRRKVASVGNGAVVGEMALLSGGLRSATVSAVTGLSGVRVAFDRVPDLLEASDGLGWTILLTATERAGGRAPDGIVDARGRPWPVR